MQIHCLKCGAHLDSPWKFCPGCGAAVHRDTQAAAVPAEHEPAPVKPAFGGLLIGIVITPILVIVGGLLCLTGLGAFLGVPMIIAGVLAPLMGPMIGFGSIQGECPCCGAKVSSIASRQSFACDGCKQTIAVKGRKFVMAPSS